MTNPRLPGSDALFAVSPSVAERQDYIPVRQGREVDRPVDARTSELGATWVQSPIGGHVFRPNGPFIHPARANGPGTGVTKVR